METESLDLAGLSRYLRRDARELRKWADQGRLPGRRVGGDWRFSRAEVSDWLIDQLSGYNDAELANVEAGVATEAPALGVSLLANLVGVSTTAVPLSSRTANALLAELVDVANGDWHVFDQSRVLSAVRAREELGPTLWPGGVAVPHPRRPMPDALGESIVAIGRTFTPIPFGLRGETVDLFFLVLCRDSSLHLQTLARLSRLCQRDGFLDSLREAETAKDLVARLVAADTGLK